MKLTFYKQCLFICIVVNINSFVSTPTTISSTLIKTSYYFFQQQLIFFTPFVPSVCFWSSVQPSLWPQSSPRGPNWTIWSPEGGSERGPTTLGFGEPISRIPSAHPV